MAKIKTLKDPKEGVFYPLTSTKAVVDDNGNSVDVMITDTHTLIENLESNTGVSEYPLFDEAKAYAVGDIVRYEGLMYRFISEHAAGTWDGTQVEEWSERKERIGLNLECGFKFKFNKASSIFCPFIAGDSYLLINIDNNATFSTQGTKNGETVQYIGSVPVGGEIIFTATANANYLRCGQATNGFIVNLSSYVGHLTKELVNAHADIQTNKVGIFKQALLNGVKLLKGIYNSSEEADLKIGEYYYNPVVKKIVGMDVNSVKVLETPITDGLYRIANDLYYFNGSMLIKFNLDERTEEIVEEKIKTYISLDVEWESGYIATSAIGNVNTMETTSNINFVHCILKVSTGEYYKINASGGEASCAYIIVDAQNVVLDKAYNNAVFENKLLTMPDGAVNLIINTYKSRSDRGIKKGDNITSVYPNIDKIAKDNKVDIAKIQETLLYTIDLASYFVIGRSFYNTGSAGSIVVPSESASSNIASVMMKVRKGESYMISGSGGSGARLYSYHDLKHKIISISAADYKGDVELNITEDGYLYVNCFITKEYKLSGTCFGDKYLKLLDNNIETNTEKLSDIEKKIEQKYFSGAEFDNYDLGEKVTMEYDTTFIKSEDVYSLYDALMSRHPSNITRTHLGDESTGLHMYRYDFKPGDIDTTAEFRPIKIMILSGTHPEYMAIRTLYKVMESIYDNWTTDNALSALRWNVEFIIIPVASPWAVDNRSRVNSRGVDMARNYPSGWVQGTFIEPPSDTSTYGGTEPLSELEAQYINSVLEENTDIVLGVDFHNHFSRNKVFWVPSALNEVRTLATIFMRQLTGILSKKYTYLNIGNIGYVDSNAPRGSFGKQVTSHGIYGMTFETANVNIESQYDTDMIDISHCGFVNYLITFLRHIVK